MNKVWVLSISPIVIIVIIFLGVMHSKNNDEFEYITEDTVYQDSSGENFIISKHTFINLSPSRSGYERLNISSEKNGFIFADKASYHEVKCVFNLKNENDSLPIYAVVYKNGSEFIAWKSNGPYIIEYTDYRINANYLIEQYSHYPSFDEVCSFLIKNKDAIKNNYITENTSEEKIDNFINIITSL